jgi:hypothetical protein
MMFSGPRRSTTAPRAISARHHERQPGGRQLQFRGVNCVSDRGMPHGFRDAPRLQPGRDPIERVTRGNLRLAPRVDEPPAAALQSRPRGGPFRPQTLEPHTVHGLERKRVLKACLGCGVQVARSLQRALARLVDAVALEADRSEAGGWSLGSCRSKPSCPCRIPKAFPADRAHDQRSLPFQLAARKRNPLFFSRFSDIRGFVPHHEASLRRGCDRGGHLALSP